MKPGQNVVRKTKSAAEIPAVFAWKRERRSPGGARLAAALVLLVCWITQLACSTSYVAPTSLPQPVGLETGVVAGSQFTPTSPSTHVDLQPSQYTPEPTATETTVPTSTSTPAAEPASTRLPNTSPTPRVSSSAQAPILYYTQAGDTLKALAARFNVQPSEITSPEPIPQEGLFNPGVLLLIPPRLGDTSPSTQLIPDSEVVYSPSALDFDIEAFVKDMNGYLSTYREWRSSGWYDGPGVIQRVGIENSINPRLLLVILERQSHWVYGQPQNLAETDFPIGFVNLENEKKGLYFQLSWAVQQLNIGYYGWRDGTVTELTFPDKSKLRLAPDLNAGTVSLLYLFSRLHNQQEWAGIMYGPEGIMAQYESMMGNPWTRAISVEPLFPATLTQPPLELPFMVNHTWAYTGGPHSAWGPDGARAALDFAPSAVEHGCVLSQEWVTASASGQVTRSENGLVVVDLDGDGYEQTGWVIIYLHIATDGRIPVGTWVNLNDRIGHPSCEGGVANGTHVHMARKYNGEWILADGPMPFVLSGWRAHANPQDYIGTLTKDDQIVYSSTVGSYESRITRTEPTANKPAD